MLSTGSKELIYDTRLRRSSLLKGSQEIVDRMGLVYDLQTQSLQQAHQRTSSESFGIRHDNAPSFATE